MKLDAIKVIKNLHILCVVDQIFILHRSDHKNNKTLTKISKCNEIIWSIKILLFCLFHLLLLISEGDQSSEWDAKLLHTKFAVMFHRKVVGCCFVAVFSNDVCDNILSNTRLLTDHLKIYRPLYDPTYGPLFSRRIVEHLLSGESYDS